MYLLVYVFGAFLSLSEACDYTATLKKFGPCKGSASSLIEMSKIGIKLADGSCNLILSGCGDVKQPIKSITVKYKVYKNNMPMLSGNKNMCGFKEKDFVMDCKNPKAFKQCLDNWEYEVPGGKGTLGMAVGTIKVVAEANTDKGKYCVEGEGVVKKK